MTIKQQLDAKVKECEELRDYHRDATKARVEAQEKARKLEIDLAAVKGQLDEVHAHVKEACVAMGINPARTPADTWTLRECVEKLVAAGTNAGLAQYESQRSEEEALQRAHTLASKLDEANRIGIRATAERDAARKENAALRREAETEHEHVKLLDAENERIARTLDSTIDQLIERGHEMARLRGLINGRGFGARVARFFGVLT